MLWPRPSLALKTLLLVFLAALCLHFFFGNETSGLVENPEERIGSQASHPVTAAQGAEEKKSSEVTDLSTFTFATRWGGEKDPALAAFSKWATEYTNAAPAQKIEMLPRGIALAGERRANFKNLIRTHPKLALAQTVPALVRRELPQPILDQLEHRVTGQGDLLVLARAEPRNVASISRRAIIDSHNYEAFVYGDRASQKTSSNISLHGVAIDDDLAVSDSPLRVFEPGEHVPAEKPLAADSCPVSQQPTAPTLDGPRPNAVAAESGSRVYWMCHGKHVRAAADEINSDELQFTFQAYATTGPRSVLIMVVDFSDLPGASAQNSEIDTAFATTDKFLHESSYGDFNFSSHTITPVLRMPRTSSTYRDLGPGSGDSMLLNDARAAARTAGFNPDIFDFDVVSFTAIGFPFAGQGYVGAKGIWIQGPFSPAVFSHETGHNLGVWHANSWNSSESPISPNGFHEEYGNPFDVMGNSSTGFPNNQYSANFKRLIGWLSPDQIVVATNTQTIRLYAHDQNSRIPNRTYGITVPTGSIVDDEVEDYWIDFRQLLAPTYPATANGAILQWGNDSGTTSASRLIDTVHTSQDKSDAPLVEGQTFADLDNGLTVKTLSKSGAGADAYLDVEISLSAPPILELAEALDTPALTWTTSTPAWNGKRNISHDGVDAAVSAPIRDNGETYAETTITGPGILYFWWKISSEPEFDKLSFSVDNQEIADISGNVDWHKRGHKLSAGPHTVRWSYKKDAGSIRGADRAWFDEVTFVTTDEPPFINSQTLALSAGVGELAELTIHAIGSDPLTYQWHKLNENGEPVPIPDATQANLIIPVLQISDAGVYNCVLGNSAGSLTSTNIVLTVVRLVTLPDALDNETIQWSTSGDSPWRGQQEFTHDNSDAAQSGAVQHGQQSTLEAALQGPGTLTFWWKVSSEEFYDLLSLYIDGDLIEYHSGELDWTQKSIPIPNGLHKIRWTYSKDSDLSEGADAAWVDQVQFTAAINTAPEFTLEPAPQSVSLGGSALFTAQYIAAEPATFTWLKDGVPLTPRANLLGLNTPTVTITNIQSSDEGSYTLKIENAFGSATSDGAALNIVPLSIADALDQPTRAFVLGGHVPWIPQTAITHDMTDAARTGSIIDEHLTWIETRVEGPATVAFWWKASTELEYDFLSFEVDTDQRLKLSGQADWRRETVVLESGPRVLRWKFRKDRDTATGDDAGWLDQLEIVPTTILQPQITNITKDATGLTATIQTLPPTGEVILECSTNLATWTPYATNTITGPTLNIRRDLTNANEFLRVRLK
jgi:hypothetical protein